MARHSRLEVRSQHCLRLSLSLSLSLSLLTGFGGTAVTNAQARGGLWGRSAVFLLLLLLLLFLLLVLSSGLEE